MLFRLGRIQFSSTITRLARLYRPKGAEIRQQPCTVHVRDRCKVRYYKGKVLIALVLVLKPLYLTNRLPFSFITYYFITKMTISHYIKFILFYVIKLLLLTLVIFKMPQLKKYNLGIDFPILKFKFDSNYYTYNYLLQYIPDCN